MGAGSGLMGKLVKLRGMGGEVSSVVCKNTQRSPFIGQPASEGQHAMRDPINVAF